MSTFTPFFFPLTRHEAHDSPRDLVLFPPAAPQQGSTHPFNERQSHETHHIQVHEKGDSTPTCRSR